MQFSEKAATVQTKSPSSVRYYGTRRSDKFVRCYQKRELGAFRVELEIHSRLLRRHNISEVEDLVHLPGVIYPDHVQFVDIDWDHLRRYLKRKLGRHSDDVLDVARQEAKSLTRWRRHLSRNNVSNPHRFLVANALNDQVTRALNRWARNFLI